MSLWLESAHSGLKLEHLDDQLRCGDSLLSDLPNYEYNFDWKKEYFSEKLFSGFDAIIGNPPWISLSGKFGENIYNKTQISFLSQKFQSNTYMPNTYEYFIWQSLELCRDNGYIGLIVPDRFGSNDQFVRLRQFISENYEIKELRYKWPFPGITADTLIIVLQKKKPSADSTAIYEYFGSDVQNVKQETFRKDSSVKLEAPRNRNTSRIIAKLTNLRLSSSLKQFCESTSGFGGKSKLMSKTRSNKNQIAVIKGASIERYKIRSHLWFHFSKENITGRTTDKSKLGARPKILLRKTGNSIIATFDDSGIFPEQSLYFLFNFKNSSDTYWILGVLNSKVVNFFYNEMAITNKGKRANRPAVDVEQSQCKIAPSFFLQERGLYLDRSSSVRVS